MERGQGRYGVSDIVYDILITTASATVRNAVAHLVLLDYR